MSLVDEVHGLSTNQDQNVQGNGYFLGWSFNELGTLRVTVDLQVASTKCLAWEAIGLGTSKVTVDVQVALPKCLGWAHIGTSRDQITDLRVTTPY